MKRLTTQISVLSGAIAVVAFVGALLLMWRAATNTAKDEREFQLTLREEELARIMQLDFKKQVQEWKDILLRGQEPKDFDHYQQQFLDEEKRVQQGAEELVRHLTLPDQRAMLEHFVAMHQDLGRRYREALASFVASGYKDYQGADRHVRGIDREPTTLIDALVGSLEKQQSDYFVDRRLALSRERKITIALIALISLGLIAGSVWTGRRLASPILHLTNLVSKVSEDHDYSVRAEVKGKNEVARLAVGLNEMLAKVQQQNLALEAGRADLQRELDERKRSEVKLAQLLSVLNGTLESTADGLLVVDRNNKVTAVNRRFIEMWKIPPEIAATCDDQQLLTTAVTQLKAPDEFLGKVRHLYEQPDAESFDVLMFKDGRVIERYSQPQRVEGVTVGRVWSFRDVTERKRAETELERLNRELLQTARQAGMAELATGVLHNVGNVLNSVNVASSCVGDILRRSKSANLGKVAALLREHETDIGDFLTRDPKGMQVLGYLEQLAEHLTREHAAVLQELGELQQNVEHIKEIVTHQQNVARLSGSNEPIKPSDLMDGAAKINQSSLIRHEIEVVREFSDLPPVSIDRNQVLQILVNLVRNAIQATEESSQPKKQITLRLSHRSDRVRFEVQDNGVGISPDNLPLIFRHGFTTKKQGHGFGLYSCALIARELGGTLEVHSDGVGKGALFTLELPVGH